jgi:hypothetical protein
MGFDVSTFIKGIEGAAKDRMIPAATRAVDQFGNHVIGKAQKLAPVETGALKASGIAQEPVVRGTSIDQVIGFNTNYAAAVHERLDLHHPQGQAKFLETPMRTEARKLIPFVEAEIKKAQ